MFHLGSQNKMTPSTNRVYIKPNSMTQTRRRFLITPLGRPVLDDSSKQTFSQNSLHSLAVIKIWKPSTATFSISEATAINVSCLESWARYIRSVRRKPSQCFHYNTSKCLHSPTNPASGNFCRSAYWQVRRLHIQQQRFLWWSDRKAKWELIADRSIKIRCTFGHFP